MSYTVAVRALCEFSAKQGDLDLRFTPSPSAREGMAGHAQVTARRAPGYQSELALEGHFGPLHVRGRADGYDGAANILEEIKTHRGAVDTIPDNQRQLHWAQLRIYGHLLCLRDGLEQVQLALVYFNIDSASETILRETAEASALAAFFTLHCERFLAWAEQEMAFRQRRDADLTALAFPFDQFRPGQRELAAAVYQVHKRQACLLAQAPTGIGKTVATLFPALKAAPVHQLDKVFYLTAKNPGRRLALDAIGALHARQPGLALRTLELVARDAACEHPELACHGQSCPLARGFYDRLPAARSAALRIPILDQAALRTTALAHGICPYYLGSEMARWSDVIIGDYNYYFDLGGALHALTLSLQWRVSVLADEAHNLVGRARAMYTATLNRSAQRAASAVASGPVKRAIGRVTRHWRALEQANGQAYTVLDAIPQELLGALKGACSAISDAMLDGGYLLAPPLQSYYFDALHLLRMSELFGDHSVVDLSDETSPRRSTSLCIRNVIPAPFLAPRFGAAYASTLFSATLMPWHFLSDTLGLPEQTSFVDVASPFQAEQLAVRLVGHIPTRYRQRAQSLAPIADLIAEQYREHPGNYFAFFSSHDYMEQAAACFGARHPDLPCWQQRRHMDAQERSDFLARFTEHSEGIAFAVLGGAFGEGIDLPGKRLVGAFVATLGLPQINAVNEQHRLCMQARFGDGYAYTYLYPGIQKVVQAAGRVIRSQSDRGALFLIDERFARPEVRALLPRWWRPERLQVS